MLNIKKNIKLAPYTTFRIGGPARFFVEVNNSEELIEAVSWAKEKEVKYFVLGGGSNVLFNDEGYNGLVVKIKDSRFQIKDLIINVGAGVGLSKIANESVDAGLTGLEWAAGVPGTLGGAICGNAGVPDGSMADIVESVEVFDGEKVRELQNKDLKFGYRTSIFKKENLIILSAKLKLQKGDKEESENLIKKYLSQRKEKQPQGFSAGSIFKNPPDNFAGKLIEECDLKGLKIGDAQISDKHANFIVNLGNATANDVLGLIEKAKNEVDKKFGIKLEEEIQIV